MFNFFKRDKNKKNSNNDYDRNDCVLKMWYMVPGNNYHFPFDEDLFYSFTLNFCKKIEFILFFNQKEIPLGNIKVKQIEENEFYITGVNTNEYCQKMGITSLLFSWVILKLIEDCKKSDFLISIDNGIKIINTLEEHNKFIYENIFPKDNPYVTRSKWHAKREFLLTTREFDEKYFNDLYLSIEKKILYNSYEIYQNWEEYYK